MRGLLSADALREKHAPPRPLYDVEGALYAPPLAGSRTAWLAWLPDDVARWPHTLDALVMRARHDGARRLAVGGPPGNYLASGVDPDDTELCDLLRTNGFVATGEHRELTVVCTMEPSSPRVTRCAHEHVDAVVASIASHFSSTWAMEATRAFSHGGLFVACDVRQRCLGFAAHSGNRAWEATFGPIGVIEAQRKTGLGAALARAVFADLRARGRTTCTVPWVDAATVRFYRKHFEVVREHTRIEYRRELS